MNQINIELKTKAQNLDKIRSILYDLKADYKDLDCQTDIYYNSKTRRLKLRKGNIKNCPIHYERENRKDSKESDLIIYDIEYNQKKSEKLEAILKKSNGIKIVVDKKRILYFLDNVRFHLDFVANLGTFVEIEAVSKNKEIPKEKLLEQGNYYKKRLEIKDENLIENSYSDMLEEKMRK